MQTQRLLIGFTLVNLAVLVASLVKPHPVGADAVAPVLRGHAFEIVDDHGHVRASISVLPADPNVKMPDGTKGYPETVLFRLINSKGRPDVKIEATEIGGALGLGGESDPTYVFMSAKGARSSLTLTTKDGRQQSIKP